MVYYRRNYQPDGLYFFTANVHNRNTTILTDHINLLKKSLQRVQKEHPYQTHAIAILPDHIHTIWQLPGDDQNYSRRWQKIKSYFTHELKKLELPIRKNTKGEFNIWQKRFWEHTITDEKDYETHVNYIHYNPVKHGLVKHVRDWPHSSFHRYAKLGVLDLDWGSMHENDSNNYGEKS